MVLLIISSLTVTAKTKQSPSPTQFLHAVNDNQYYREVDKETVN